MANLSDVEVGFKHGQDEPDFTLSRINPGMNDDDGGFNKSPGGDFKRKQKLSVDIAKAAAHANMTMSSNSIKQPLDMVVYLMNKTTSDTTGLQFSVEDGKNVTAGEIVDIVIEELGLPHEARSVFSMWFISPLLEIQLKPHHAPFHVIQQWDELLDKYTSADEDDIEIDDPILVFKRQVFLTKEEEKQIQNENIKKWLYYEANTYVREGRYPVEKQDCNTLAGIQALIELKAFNPTLHTKAFYKEKVKDFFPEHAYKKSWDIFKSCKSSESAEDTLAVVHENATYDHNNKTYSDLYSEYLKICWKFPYYGSAYFYGQIEKPVGKFGKLKDHHDIPVFVAINREGVYVIDYNKVSVLLKCPYKDPEFRCEHRELREEHRNDRTKLPSFFLHFRPPDEKNDEESGFTPNTKLLQIFSRQSVMMYALAKACWSSAYDDVDDANGDAEEKPKCKQHDSCMSNKLNRLSLATINPEGIISSS